MFLHSAAQVLHSRAESGGGILGKLLVALLDFSWGFVGDDSGIEEGLELLPIRGAAVPRSDLTFRVVGGLFGRLAATGGALFRHGEEAAFETLLILLLFVVKVAVVSAQREKQPWLLLSLFVRASSPKRSWLRGDRTG